MMRFLRYSVRVKRAAMIKVDMHMHTGEDPSDGLRYPATTLLEKAAALGFGAVAITLHRKVLEDERLEAFARERGFLLIRGVEWKIKKCDVLLYNVRQREVDQLLTFDDLRAFKRDRGDDLLVVAPHPHYPVHQSLGRKLEEHIDLFDAVEHSSVHLGYLNFNKSALRLARQYGKPVVANSDAHNLWMFGRHYTLVDAEPTIPSIFAAIREGRLQWHSPPMSVWDCLRLFVFDPVHRQPGRIVKSFEQPA